ncbi:hypothetical protein Q9L58_008659 [Maublancomyces gigas]|uniref:Rhodopsin domain-containing protein n=1 Tax=Discina gigas TaxID=1032678 RepID=A0ABR3G939_9PEZI
MTLGPLLFCVELPLLVLSTIFVGLRFYCRKVIVRNLGLDDWIMFIALLNAWGIGQVWIWKPYNGPGNSQNFPDIAFECPRKPSLAWSPTAFPKECNNLVPVYYAQAAFNILSDIVILLLPVPLLLRLQVNRSKKIALIFIVSIGGIAVVASIVRINALYIFQHSSDVPYDGIYILLWSAVEINAAIISASAPSLRPLVKSIIGGPTGKSGFARSGYGGSQVHQITRNRAAPQSFTGTSGDAEITTNVSGSDVNINESDESIAVKTGTDQTTGMMMVGDENEYEKDVSDIV